VARNGAPEAASYTDVVELDLGTVEPSLAGPKRPQDRVPLRNLKQVFRRTARTEADGGRSRAKKNPSATGSAQVGTARSTN
jgi:aconitate hydratase